MVDDNTRHFRVVSMDCADEVAVFRHELGPPVGAEERLSFDVLRGRLTLSAKASDVGSRQVMDAVAKTGMRAEPWSEESSVTEPKRIWQRWGRSALTGSSGIAIAVAVTLHAWLTGSVAAAFGAETTTTPWIVRVVYGMAVVAGAWFVVPKAWYAARRLRPDMNLLMIVAVLGAAFIGEWFEAAAVAFLFSLSLLLESSSVGRARRAVAALMDLAPPTVRLRTDGGDESLVSPEEVPVGATFVVKPKERIPLDGERNQGHSSR
jgi:Cd2+/Zn2+-exporting ATPase